MPEKVCFVIAPIGEPESEIRKRSDKVLKHVIKPAVKGCGYEAQRADEISDPGIITTQVIQKLIDAPLVVADLTGWNPNVFYELAVRHAFGKPVIQLIQRGEKIPFDVATMRTIQLDHQDLDSVAEVEAEIIRQIASIEAGTKNENPVSVTIDLQALRESADPKDKGLAEVLSAIAELRQAQSQQIESLEDDIISLLEHAVVTYAPGVAGPSGLGTGVLGSSSIGISGMGILSWPAIRRRRGAATALFQAAAEAAKPSKPQEEGKPPGEGDKSKPEG